MSNFRMEKVGTYTFTHNKANRPMFQITLDLKQLTKVKENDYNRFYIYDPKVEGGDVIGLVFNG